MKKRLTVASVIVLCLLTVPMVMNDTHSYTSRFNPLGIARVSPAVTLLDRSFSPIGGIPFCFSKPLGSILCYSPNFLKAAYDFPPNLDGSGQTIVTVDAFGSPTLQGDLNTFSTAFGLQAATVTILCGPSWSGASTDKCPTFDLTLPIDQQCGALGWWEETSLDVAMVHGLAPGAKIVLVVADDCSNNSLNAAERAVVHNPGLRGSTMSQSFGQPDDLVGCSTVPCPTKTIDRTVRATADKTYSTALSNGWTVIASSGDDGANEALSAVGTPELTPSWPSTSPLVLAAGGTQGQPYGGQYGRPPGPNATNTCPANTNCNTGLVIVNGGTAGCSTAARPGVPTSCYPVGYGGEASWNEYNVFGVRTSSGGGVSTQYARPLYQASLPSKFTTLLGATVIGDGRLTPDVSFNTGLQGGLLVYLGFLGRWGVFGGTSASSPAWAGIIALLDQAHGSPIGFLNTAIYQLSESAGYHRAFHDITSGNNSDTAGRFGVDGYTAGHGYDLTTGWGSPDVAKFITGIDAICSPGCPGP